MIPLSASSDAVAAYLRREGTRVVLVVLNLGATPLDRVTLSSGERVLRAGQYAPKALLGERTAARLRVGSDGRIRGYVVLPTIGAMEGNVFEIERKGR